MSFKKFVQFLTGAVRGQPPEDRYGDGAPDDTERHAEEVRALPPLRMLVFADLHSTWWETVRDLIQIADREEYDCVLFLGDICADDIRAILPHTKGVPCLYVLGNHDGWNQNKKTGGLTDMDGKTIVINGIRISGVSGGPKYKYDDHAMRTEEEMEKALEGVGETDILISHDSPYHLMGTNWSHGGFAAITDFIDREKPALHIFGHHHTDHEEIVRGTREICVYGCALITTSPFEIQKLM